MLRTIDAQTGALLWERPVPERWGHVSVVRAHPVVVSTAGADEGAPRRLVVVGGGETEREIELPRWAEEFGGDVAVVGETCWPSSASARRPPTARRAPEARSTRSTSPRGSSAGPGAARTVPRSPRWPTGVTSWS
ncbi:hypothetical protein ACRJ4W_52665 [Streptomyces sp. GLT-R25]